MWSASKVTTRGPRRPSPELKDRFKDLSGYQGGVDPMRAAAPRSPSMHPSDDLTAAFHPPFAGVPP
jgi:hypothetical protein